MRENDIASVALVGEMRTFLAPVLASLAILASSSALAEEHAIGQVKTSAGEVFAVRDGARRALAVGDRLAQSDLIRTGAQGSVGITFADNSMMSLGPNSVLSLESFAFDSTTNQGRFATRLDRGTLAVKSGKIVQQTPEAMTVQTRNALLGVRGTEFVVRADDAE